MPLALVSKILLLSRILLLALAYFVAGRLALLLAIPPGFATAIFPPLGVSLAAVLLWGNSLLLGVFIGSVILNVSIAIMGVGHFEMAMFFTASEIALGSSLAAWVGASLIRKFVGFPNALMDEWSIFFFFLFGGPVASIVSATIGVGALCLNGVIPLSHIIYSWVTWWTGDTIGVLIATPFVFILFAVPRKLWRDRSKTVGIPLLISCALIVVIFINTSQSEEQKIQRSVQSSANELSETLFSGLAKHIAVLTPLKGLFVASEEVTPEDFRLFTAELLAATNGISVLSWNQNVGHTDRSVFEKNMIDEGYKNFSIKEYGPNHQLVTAPHRERYVVVTYVEPYAKNGSAQGFDILSDEVRHQALLYSNSTGLPSMTAPLHLVQAKSTELSYVIYMPVYKTLDAPKTRDLRDQLLRGYVTAIVKVGTQIEVLHEKFPKENFVIRLQDITDEENVQDVYSEGFNEASSLSRSHMIQVRKKIAGRDLLLSILPTEKFIDKQLSATSWYVLVGGLLFCSFLGGFLLLFTGRAQYVASLVERRTLELESILNGAVEAIIIINQIGEIERANPAACRLFKMRENELLGLNSISIIPLLHDLLFTPEGDYNQTINSSVWKARETTGICSDKTKLPLEIGVSGVDLPDRRIYTCLIHDVTARKKVDKLKDEFVSTVSHELRTPLTSITGALGLLVGGAVPNLPIKALDLLVIAKNNAERLGRLVNDILDIEKLEFGKLQLDITDCDANELMRQSIEQNTGYAVKYGVHLALNNSEISNLKITLLVDPDRFLQVMSNLISNAIKFSQMDGVVTVYAKVDGDQITFYVEDEGAGIPEEFRSKIFQKFAQADSSDTRKRDGTGLGLSISRVIVERMGGTLDYTTEINKGTVFFFSIPIEEVSVK
ncbi:MAG: PAS domain S-box protein [Gammaproteobacteria bacterium]|nr:MAG: PAS domain S-box protein [Gammaproteobacteria bacterium]